MLAFCYFVVLNLVRCVPSGKRFVKNSVWRLNLSWAIKYHHTEEVEDKICGLGRSLHHPDGTTLITCFIACASCLNCVDQFAEDFFVTTSSTLDGPAAQSRRVQWHTLSGQQLGVDRITTANCRSRDSGLNGLNYGHSGNNCRVPAIW